MLGRIFLNSRKERQKDGKTERRKDGVFLWDVEELTFLKINLKGYTDPLTLKARGKYPAVKIDIYLCVNNGCSHIDELGGFSS